MLNTIKESLKLSQQATCLEWPTEIQ